MADTEEQLPEPEIDDEDEIPIAPPDEGDTFAETGIGGRGDL
jgi:hypothetical protein